MNICKKTFAFLAAGGVASLAFAGPVSASSDPGADALAKLVAQATSSDLKSEDVPVTKNVDGTFGVDGRVDISIPSSANGKVAVSTKTQTGSSINVGISTGSANAAPGKLASDGSVTYNEPGPVDHTVQGTLDGVRIHTVVSGAEAPTEFTHDVTLSKGARLVLEKDMPALADAPKGAAVSGAVFIVNDQGDAVGGFSPPWAKDSTGASIPTHYTLAQGKLVQVVDHRASGVVYPVVADPYLGFNMISSATWVWHTEGWTFQVSPTGWARGFGGAYLAGVYGWDELYARYRNAGLNTNLDGMRDQHICHQQFAFLKSTWNLDEWRPNYSYAATVNAKCNPGGSKWFD